MAGGRPLRFKDAEELSERIQDYFSSMNKKQYYKIPKKDRGQIIDGEYEFKPVLDENGDYVYKYDEKTCITGLALHLDTSRETLMNYQKREEFFDTVKGAKDYIEYITESGNDVPAIKIFKLKQHGWVDKLEIDHSGETNQNINANVNTTIDISSLTLEELNQLESIVNKTTEQKSD